MHILFTKRSSETFIPTPLPMTSDQTTSYKDEILQCLADSKRDLSVNQISESTSIPFDTVFALTNSMADDGNLNSIDTTTKDGSDKLLSIKPEGRHFLSLGGYSESFRSETVRQRKMRNRITSADVIKIALAIIFGVSAGILGWLKYLDDQTIKQQQKEIQELKSQIHRLQTEK